MVGTDIILRTVRLEIDRSCGTVIVFMGKVSVYPMVLYNRIVSDIVMVSATLEQVIIALVAAECADKPVFH